ncbi:MAG: CpaF family protein [Bacteroidales bacterium]|nr:CpaF family protein [Bacteroidales bacterium]MCM1415566.1 CpaF family protein [bacterium]MCM1424094.1 CpaF family protein [bacterium]
METNAEDRKRLLRERLLESIDYSRESSDEEICDLIDEMLMRESRERPLSLQERKRLRRELFHAVRKLDVLQELVDDPDITEIMINGPDRIFIEQKGRLKESELQFESEEKLQNVIQQIVSDCNRTVNEASPIVDARLQNGARVNVVLNPVALNGPIVTIRRFPDKPITMKDLVSFSSVTEEVCAWLQKLVQAKYNIFISGGTGSGKTTFLNALSNYIPQEERIITIEDSAELQLINVRNIVRMETRNANVDGCQEITIRDLIKTSLRMRPDRIIVGEVRGGEAFDMMQCLNTGHDGSMSTGHANSARDMLGRLENMILMGMEIPLTAIRQQIASGIDIIVHLGRLRDKSRKVLEIVEVTGYADGEIQTAPLYRFEEEGEAADGRLQGVLKKKGELVYVEKLQSAGLW